MENRPDPGGRLAIIIATKDRPDELDRLLQSISIQKVKPSQIIVADGGERKLEFVLDKFKHLNINYIKKRPASLTSQRNAGIRALEKYVTIVAFLDDDTVLERDSLEEMMKFWESAPVEVGGASFNLTNEVYKKPTIMEKIFFVNTDTPSKVLRSGFQGKVSYVSKTTDADWLVGCAMVFRRKIFEEFMFDEWYSGYARYEDVDFTYRVGRKYKLCVVAEARILHLNKPEDISFSFNLGRMEVVNRLYFVRKNKELSLALCYWALFGYFLNNAARGTLFLNKRYALRALGNVAGFIGR